MRVALVLAAIVALAGGCAGAPAHPDAFAFAIMGDTPYNEAEERQFVAMIERMDREPLAFVVHVGDFKGGGACSDALYAKRRAQFDASAHPLVYTPGDNEWTDCRHRGMGAMDPIERLARLRQVFFADRLSLGATRMELAAQTECVATAAGACRCPAHPENRAWSQGGVRFVTLDIPGSDNNVGFDAANDAEARCRDEANLAWLAQALRAGELPGTRALVVIIHANPWDSKKPVYREFLRALQEGAQRLRKPVLLIHGDTHTLRIDSPFTDSLGNATLAMTRLETYGSPFVGWVKVIVDPGETQLFRFEPHLHAFVPPK